MLTAVGPIEGMDLLSERALDDGLTRRLYRVRFQRRTIDFVVRADGAGRFAEIRPLSGDDI
ncbi:hypothetical protein [Brevundimonas sp.]|nr:hypothetical protein [Brevundimonas sp.]PZU71563.1 MAG: hypothetical protein DI531_15665 [Brevundimonas sp.]